MATEKIEVDPSDCGSADDLARLLEERARLEERIRRDYTRTITVMFTDFKGSTALAETEGDMASRLLIKQHHDMLFPILEESRGVLVKTMGDGTLSWFERAQDGVTAAVRFQRALHAFNRSRPGKTPIVVRIGLNTGTGIVEAHDVFGDAVNVAARFEALAAPGEICISESCYDAMSDREEFPCRYWKMAELKGKSGLHKAFRVNWNPEAAPEEAAADATPAAGARSPASGTPRTEGAQGQRPPVQRGFGAAFRSPGMFRPAPPEAKRRPDTGWIQQERDALARATNVLSGLLVRRGDTRRLTGEAYRVKDDIVVEEGGLLVVEGAQLFFEPAAGIVSSGAVRAKGSLFGAVDPSAGWRNVAIDPREERVSFFERCTFRFGKGRDYASLLRPGEDGPNPGLRASFLYGGGLLVRGGSEKSVPVTDCTFHRCAAHEGGGVMLSGSTALLSRCVFEQCTAGVTGGGAACLDGAPVLRNCTFNGCSAALGGGGASLRASRATFDGCSFDRCSTGHLHGGGILVVESSPFLSGCRFTGCVAVRESGAVHRDEASSPRVVNASYSGCRPTDTNVAPALR
jgi:class 3 adenylate cyclase